MPKIRYVSKSFREDALGTIARAEAICDAYAAQGFSLTLRQLYYQFVSRGWIANKDSEYKRLGSIINDARLAGLIDWDHLEDRTRNVRDLTHWDSPASIMRAVAAQFRYESWNDQPMRVVVMIEKDALVGVIENVCQVNDVPFFSCRGYVSQSEMWAMARRFVGWIRNGQQPIVLHLGDHDPSGLDMSEDIDTRLSMFVAEDAEFRYADEVPEWIQPFVWDEDCDPEKWREALKRGYQSPTFVKRLALNWDQIQTYSPPPNPAKATDARFSSYLTKYGAESWELDALDPTMISGLIQSAIDEYVDTDLWNAAQERIETERKRLNVISRNWAAIASHADETYGESAS
jgi:hypothetical protein